MKVRYFGVLSEITMKISEEIEFQGSVSAFKSLLTNRYSEMNDQDFRVAVNQKMVDDAHILTEEDELALLPPFAGG